MKRNYSRRVSRALAAVVVMGVLVAGMGLLATSVQAGNTPPTFTFVPDDAGANDEPGQKDLTADASKFDADSDFWVAWKWDDTRWSGSNTGDACALFDEEGDGNADFAVCVTIGSPAQELSTRVYSCTDARADRCTGSTLVDTEGSGETWCVVTNNVAGGFAGGGNDTQASCNISNIADDVPTLDTDILNSANFLNSCSYPSQQPNSDPSDCVHQIPNLNTSVSTLSSGTTTWSATLNDTATLNPTTATGSVVFKLWSDASCTTLVWQSTAVNLASGTASTVGAGTASGSNTITQATVDGDGVYYWTVQYTPTGAFNSSSSACGEATTITPASVGGTAG